MVEDQPKPAWAPVPHENSRGVEFRVLLAREGIFLANLRFSSDATIHRHSAPHEIDVVCIHGAGFTSVGDEALPIHAGQTVRWPRNVDHCLWTEGSEMETLMVERYSQP